MTHEELLEAVRRAKVPYNVTEEDHKFTSMTFGVYPNWKLHTVERTSQVVIL